MSFQARSFSIEIVLRKGKVENNCIDKRVSIFTVFQSHLLLLWTGYKEIDQKGKGGNHLAQRVFVHSVIRNGTLGSVTRKLS